MDDKTLARMARSILDEKNSMQGIWDWLSRKIKPRKNDILHQVNAAEFQREYCTTAAEALRLLTNGFMSHVMPSGETWFQFSHGGPVRTEKHSIWYQNANDVTYRALATSRFYAVMHEFHDDRNLFGTGCAYCDWKKEGGLLFKNVPIGTYGFQRDYEGTVNALAREFRYTAAQAVQAWGLDALPEVVRRAYEREQDRYTREFTFCHFVVENDRYSKGNGRADMRPEEMPFLSVYFYANGHWPVVQRGGYEEFPYLVSVYEEWEGLWGYPPGLQVLNEIGSSLLAERHLDELGALAVYPRLFADAEQVGDIDPRAGGVTVVDRNVAGLNLPREWGTSGRYDVGLERLERADKKIQAAFHTQFLLAVSSVEGRELTATEVVARQREQVLGISGTFKLFASDFDVFLARIFGLLFRHGKYNTKKATQPHDLLVTDGDHIQIARPDVQYLGVVAQSVALAQQQNLQGALRSAAEWVQVTGDATALDGVDSAEAVKWLFTSQGAPSSVLRPAREVERIRKERTAVQERQAALESMQAAAAGGQAMKSMADAEAAAPKQVFY